MIHKAFRNYKHLTEKIFINAPYSRLCTDLLQTFLDNDLQPEIGLEGNDLWDVSPQNFRELARVLRKNNLNCTLHAPFHDLTPGGFDREITRVTREKLKRAFDLLPIFQPQSIVCHLGYNELKHSQDFKRWLNVSTETWSPLLAFAQRMHVPVMFENTYERAPDVHLSLQERLSHLKPQFCLDTGHVLAFSNTDWQSWLSAFNPYLGQLHLHDNDGHADRHSALGTGIFDFKSFFSVLQKRPELPIITLEQRSAEDILTSLSYLDRNLSAQ